MSPDAVARDRLRDRLDEVLGRDEAATLMASLPEPGAAPVTVPQLDERVRDLRTEIAAQGDQLRTEMATQGDQLRTEMATQGDQLRTEMAAQGEQLRTEMGALRHELIAAFRGELMAAISSQTRTIVYANLGLMFGGAAMAFSAVRLFG